MGEQVCHEGMQTFVADNGILLHAHQKICRAGGESWKVHRILKVHRNRSGIFAAKGRLIARRNLILLDSLWRDCRRDCRGRSALFLPPLSGPSPSRSYVLLAESHDTTAIFQILPERRLVYVTAVPAASGDSTIVNCQRPIGRCQRPTQICALSRICHKFCYQQKRPPELIPA